MNAASDRPRILVGIGLLILGVVFLSSNFGFLRGLNAWGVLWGMFWVWLGAVVIGPRGQAVGSGRLALGLLLLVNGVVTLGDGLGVIPFSAGYLFSRFWPIVLIALGLLVLVESGRRQTAPAEASASKRIWYDVVFGDIRLTEPGWELRDVQANILIGDMKINLARAQIPDGETPINVRALIGDIDVRAPRDLPVAIDVQCVLATLNLYGRKLDVVLRRHVDVPQGYDLAPKRVRVCANMLFGDLNLTRAG